MKPRISHNVFGASRSCNFDEEWSGVSYAAQCREDNTPVNGPRAGCKMSRTCRRIICQMYRGQRTIHRCDQGLWRHTTFRCLKTIESETKGAPKALRMRRVPGRR